MIDDWFRSCATKRAYDTAEEAAAPRTRVYYCDWCNRYHRATADKYKRRYSPEYRAQAVYHNHLKRLNQANT